MKIKNTVVPVILLAGIFVLSFAGVLPAKENELTIKSPDGKIAVAVSAGEHLSYAVNFHGQRVLEKSELGITVDSHDLGQNVEFSGKAERHVINEQYRTRGLHDIAVNHCNVIVIGLTSDSTQWQLEVRVFNDGVACQYRVSGSGSRHIDGESTEWTVPVGSTLWRQDENNSSYESKFYPDIVGQLPKGMKLMAPATLKFPGDAGYGMMTEANLISYSDMALQAAGASSFKALFHYDADGWDQNGEIVSPWRVTVLAQDLNTLVNSDIIKNLCPPAAPELANADWIKPGRSIWHWLTGGSPKLEEQNSWIDGTKQMGYEYYLVDDGWRDWNGGGDNAWNAMRGVVDYAKSQGVKIWVWVHSKYVFKPDERVAYFKRARELGIVGLKIDFPHPANSAWVQWYDDTLRDAAAVGLMIDIHGAVKPTGRERTWPNEMTREAISGREQGKNPSVHDTTLPFVRYVQGPADYTPTLFIPKRLDGSSFAHELAMPIVFTSPFLCMGDSPKHYLESDAADVLKALPSLWDKTIVLPESEIGQLAAYARRHGDQWFVGMINGTTPRRETVSLNFLGKGNYKLIELADSPDRNDAFVRSERIVTSKDSVVMPLRKDGGYVAWLVPEGSGK
ncbi:MAG TPA: glycoside hydrolase family 97 catalytic domain-containing protein [Verrucomicrobiae bacterium]|jgi:alpha-glucosidase|nr:glycoside hydrolase family 97 catalytic domain-containing protein [Verrucomicrobiae bacterium]